MVQKIHQMLTSVLKPTEKVTRANLANRNHFLQKIKGQKLKKLVEIFEFSEFRSYFFPFCCYILCSISKYMAKYVKLFKISKTMKANAKIFKNTHQFLGFWRCSLKICTLYTLRDAIAVGKV